MYAYLGSSPLARGLRHHPIRGGPRRGIIPARAGFTWRGTRPAPWGPDHPRSRGVYRRHRPRGHGRERIIPARAGFTRSPRRGLRRYRDHPRSRGVYFGTIFHYFLSSGSSPLARGLLERTHHARHLRRIIPARAGFTCGCAARVGGSWDHPRSRGVYYRERMVQALQTGSSPLARGLPAGRDRGSFRGGIIPARAGFTRQVGLDPLFRTDHPRSRGVYKCRAPKMLTGRGSSPLARGLPVKTSSPCTRTGIIPARAGFTRRPRQAAGTSRDHPRSRGVYFGRAAPDGSRPGSSPLARGLPIFSSSERNTHGIIPARAGFTPP